MNPALLGSRHGTAEEPRCAPRQAHGEGDAGQTDEMTGAGL